MSGRQMNAALTVTADASRVVSELRRGSEAMRDFRRTGEASAPAISRSARDQEAALKAMAQAAALAAMHQDDLVAAEMRSLDVRRRAQAAPLNVFSQPVASSNPAGEFANAQTSADSLRQTVSGMNMTLSDAVLDMMAATAEAREYRFALDEVRAAFSPLFAASKRYEAELDAIARAERIGAISAREAADARERAARVIAPAVQEKQGPSGADLYAAFRQEQADQAARSYQALEASLDPVIRAERELAAAQDVVNRAVAQGQTTHTSAARTLAQLETRYQGIVRANSPAAQSAAALEQAIESEAEAFRRLTFALDPAARATAEMEAVQERLNRAVKMGLTSQDEAARLKGLHEAAQGPGGNSRGAGAMAANLSFQMNDVAMMTAMGQAPMMVMLQQGPQVAQVFSQIQASGQSMGTALASAFRMMITPWGFLAMAVIGGGAAIAQGLMSLVPRAKSLSDRMTDLSGAFGRYKDASAVASATSIELARDFGVGADAARDLYSALTNLSRVSLDQQLRATAPAVREMFRFQGESNLNNGADDGNAQYNRRRFTRFFELGNSSAEVVENNRRYHRFSSALRNFETATGIDDQVAAMTVLVAQVEELATLQGGISKREQKLIDLMKEQAEVLLGIQAVETARETRRQQDIDAMVRGHEQQVELSRAIVQYGESSLAVESLRTMQAREALERRLEEMGVIKGSAQEMQVLAAFDAEAAAAVDERAAARSKEANALIDDLRRQNEISAAMLQFGAESAEVEAVRARNARDVNDERLKEMGLTGSLLTLARGLFALEQQRADAIRQAEANRKADDMMTDLREQAAINAAIVAHGRESLQVKELMISAERRAYEESLRSLDVSEQRKRELMVAWEATHGLTAPDPFGQIAVTRQLMQSQQERLASLRLEISLLGHTEAARARILALWRAELEIRRAGIDSGSARATELRAAATEEAELTRQLERQQAAWGGIQNAAESAIDGIVEKLRGGDIEGALEALASNLTGILADLAISNPMKNIILGRDLPTMDDVGGLRGIWGRLTGGPSSEDITLPELPVSNVDVMSVQAASVVIGGPGVASLLSAANSPNAPGVTGGAGFSGSAEAQALLRSVAVGGGARPDAISGLRSELADPLAALVREAQSRFGTGAVQVTSAYRSNERQAQLWQEAVQKYGSPEAARRWVAPPGASRHSHGLAADIRFASPDAQTWVHQNAGRFGLGFRMAHEPWHIEPQNAAALIGRQAAPAAAAMTNLTKATEQATNDLGTLGNGFDVIGSALSGAMSGGKGGAVQAVIGAIGSAVAGALKIPGFALGGRHAGGLRIVGENGPELEYTGPSTIIPANLTRQLMNAREDRWQTSSPAPVMFQPRIEVINRSSTPVSGEMQEVSDERGQRQYKLVLSDMVGEGIAVPGGQGQRAMQSRYGIAPSTRRRNG